MNRIEHILIALIAMLIGYIFYAKVRHARELRTIAKKLQSIIEHPTPILSHTTNDPALKELLIALNRVLHRSSEASISFKQKEMAMKKMLTNISHDLRTPLTVVLGLVESILYQPSMDETEKMKGIQLVHYKAEEIVHLINRLFEWVRLESDDEDIQLEKLNVSEICKRNVLSFYQQIEAEGLAVELALLDQPLYGLGNEEALNRALGNLIANAIRYGYEGNVIGMSLRADTQFVYIDIWDRGRGIPESYQDLVFERSIRMEGNQKQGSGLGLHIVKRLLGKMQGDVQIVSLPFERTTITVKLKRMWEREGMN
ncbi:sensor histidine kinase [Hazenella sp. IB182357]|uniref:histidine kinase n=1 Tax=Polycladospora coralii TaxID=2771432 RepID=A0A926NBU7_9BACL|nr:sensor histidine kinase [Polycladospora coralii]